MNSLGFERPKTARANAYNFSSLAWNTDSVPRTEVVLAVDASAVASNQKYLDQHDQSITVVCSGTPRLLTAGLGFLKEDQADGENGCYVLWGVGLAPIKAADTPANGAFLYWDDTNKYLTTTSSGNTKAAVNNQLYTEWTSGSATDGTQPPVVSGVKWGRVEVRPFR